MTNAATPIRFSAKTHRGRVRQTNEDNILVRPEIGLWVVSDGMGGHVGGALASRIVTYAFAVIPDGLHCEALVEEATAAVLDAHAAIRQESDAQSGATIGATAAALLLADGAAVALWVGDSRVYRFRAGALEMLTSDHSVVGDLVRAGELTWDEAEAHPRANVITRAVGVGEDLNVDVKRETLLPGDRFLLCSDGLTKYANAALLSRMMSETEIATSAEGLLSYALNCGGEDNVSLILVDNGGG